VHPFAAQPFSCDENEHNEREQHQIAAQGLEQNGKDMTHDTTGRINNTKGGCAGDWLHQTIARPAWRKPTIPVTKTPFHNVN
jgi:hypothetical protein